MMDLLKPKVSKNVSSNLFKMYPYLNNSSSISFLHHYNFILFNNTVFLSLASFSIISLYVASHSSFFFFFFFKKYIQLDLKSFYLFLEFFLFAAGFQIYQPKIFRVYFRHLLMRHTYATQTLNFF